MWMSLMFRWEFFVCRTVEKLGESQIVQLKHNCKLYSSQLMLIYSTRRDQTLFWSIGFSHIVFQNSSITTQLDESQYLSDCTQLSPLNMFTVSPHHNRRFRYWFRDRVYNHPTHNPRVAYNITHPCIHHDRLPEYKTSYIRLFFVSSFAAIPFCNLPW